MIRTILFLLFFGLNSDEFRWFGWSSIIRMVFDDSDDWDVFRRNSIIRMFLDGVRLFEWWDFHRRADLLKFDFRMWSFFDCSDESWRSLDYRLLNMISIYRMVRVFFFLNRMMDFRLVGRSHLDKWDGFFMRAGRLTFDFSDDFCLWIGRLNSDHTGDLIFDLSDDFQKRRTRARLL